MQYRIIIIITCLAVVSSCSFSSNSYKTLNNPNTFAVDEAAFNKGILRIFLPDQVPKNLAIRTPSGEWFILQESEESIESMPQARFESVKIIEFKIKELKGTIWRDSRKVTELIFKYPGSYLVYFADNLETEPENTFSLQKIIIFDNSANN